MIGKYAVEKRWLMFALILMVTAPFGEAWAQKRLLAKVEPNLDETERLVFDVNIDFSDNIAPNIVLSKDGKRGFVSYTGSGTVLVFSTETGEVLGRIKTGGKPSFATPLPDQRTVAVVSVLDNKVFLIDMDSSSLLTSYSFASAQFGFGSILSVSPDGALGYISSTGTGEVVKFALADGKEVGRMKDLQAPAQITLSLDGSTLMIVDTLKEELVFTDASSLTRKSTLKGKDISINFTIFNKAVLSPDGTTGIIASRDLNGILGSDTVFLFKVSNGEILATATIGSEPGYTTLTPDGMNWTILNDFSLSLISTEDFTVRRELTTVRGEPLGSANIVFSPDSRYAFYASSASDLVFQHDLLTSGVVGQISVGDNPNQFLDQPSSMAIGPDGKTIVVLNFVGNTLDLLTDAWVLQSTKFSHSADQFTGLTLINFSTKPAKFTVIALNNFGEIMADEGVENPKEYTLGPNNQISLTLGQIFNFDENKERAGWLAVFSDQPDVTGYVSIGDTSLGRVDGVPLFRAPLFDWVIPEVVRKEGKSAELNIVNAQYNQATYNSTRILQDGSLQEARTNQIAFPTNRHAQVFGDIYIQPEEVTDGYLRMVSGAGLLLTEFFGGESATGALNAIDMDNFFGIKKIYSPQFAIAPGFRTILNVINGSGEDAEVIITLHGPEGTVIGEPLRKSLVRDEQIKDDLATLFPAARDVTGWLEIESSQDRIVGTVTFTNDDETFLSSFELSGKHLTHFLFPIVAQNEVYQTRIALLNNNDTMARVTLELWGTGGSVDRSTSFTVAPKSRTALYLNSYFPELEPRLTGHLRVRSDHGLHAFSLINERNFNFTAAVPAIPLP